MTPVNMLQEASTVNDLTRNIHRINVALEDRNADHQPIMLEVEGKISNTPVSILIDYGSSLSYIAPKIVENCKLVKEKNAWLVQLATGVKQKVTEIVKDYIMDLDNMDTSVNLNILPLGSYDILIGMDWLESHKDVIDYLHKIFSSVDGEDKYHRMNEIYGDS